MSGIVQIVGQSSGVSKLLEINSSGEAVIHDPDNIVQTTAVNAKLVTIDAVLDNSLIQQTACATDLAAIEVLQTGGNASLSACATDLAAIEVLQTGGNASLSACATDLAAIEVLQTAIKSRLDGTLSVSAPTLSTTSAVLENATSVSNSATETTASTDIAGVRRVAFFGALDDSSGNLVVEVSADNSTFFDNTEQTIYISNGNFFKTMDIDARYVRVKYANTSGSTKNWTCIISRKS